MESILNTLMPAFTSLTNHRIGEPILFSSMTFWILFIFFIAIYALVRRQKTRMMVYVISFSLFFYFASNGPVFIILPGTAFIDWALALLMVRFKQKWMRKVCLIYSVCMSVGILFSFKYTNFFLETWNNLLANNLQPFDIFLPIGISFYTFQTISYVTDVYRGKLQPTESFLQYLFYISFFPLILAGPIMRADKFFSQIQSNKIIGKAMIYGGLWLIIIGIIKKAVFADYIAQYNNWIFDNPMHYSGFEGAMAVIGYSAQIYCDFSGYSDMSIGIASIMGFTLGKNFNLPYQATNLSVFWQRWHISLSTWMRDYIYIPLGGNRCGKFRTYLNNLLTMLVAGLWHGASWMFVIWGGLHGLGLILQKVNKPWLDRLPNNRIIQFCSWLLTFGFITFLWIFFRSENLDQSTALITRIGSDFDPTYLLPFLQTRTTWCVFMLLIFLFHSIRSWQYDKLQSIFIRSPWIVKLLLFALAIQLVIQFHNGDIQPFIYFQF